MKKFLAFVVTLLVLSPIAKAEYLESDGRYIYRVTPWTELGKDQDAVKVTAQIAYRALISVLESMKGRGMLPENVMTIGDIERLRRSRQNVDDLMDYLNGFIEEQRARGRYEFTAKPSAFMIFLGGRWAGGIFSGGLTGGFVFVPVRVDQFDLSGDFVKTSYGFRSSPFGAPNVDARFGLGAGGKARVGFGLVYDFNSSFMRPEQFGGWGFAGSMNHGIGPVTANFKMGTLWSPGLKDSQSNGKPDFGFATAAWEFGPSVEVAPVRAGPVAFFNGYEVMNAVTGMSRRIMENANKDLTRQLNEFAEELRTELGVRAGKDGVNKDQSDDSRKKKGEEEIKLPGGLKGHEGDILRK